MRELKCVVVGDGAVGKTSMLLSYTTNIFPSDHTPTVFDNYNTIVHLGGQDVNLYLWDTAGQEEYQNLRPLSYLGTDVFILVFALSSPRSFQHVSEVWMKEIKSHEPNGAIVLVGSKMDLRTERQHEFEKSLKDVSPERAEIMRRSLERNKEQGDVGRELSWVTTEEGLQKADEIGAIAYQECSSITREGLVNVFEEVVRIGLAKLPPPPVVKKHGLYCKLKRRLSSKNLAGDRNSLPSQGSVSVTGSSYSSYSSYS